jgi:hypothetical protein
MQRVGRVAEGKPYSVKTILGYLKSWKTLLFTLIFSKQSLTLKFSLVPILILISAMQPFCAQPTTSFVFWLKAHNKKGKPPVYSIAQIVSIFLILPYLEVTDEMGYHLERVPNYQQCFHCCVVTSYGMDLRWTA